MTLDELAPLLPPDLGLEVHGLYARYSEGPGDGIDGFLRHLHEQKLITADTFRELHAREEVTIGGLSGLGRLADFLAPEGSPGHKGDDDDDDVATKVLPALQEPHQLLGVVGSGGMAMVHVARETALGRKVAYKQLLATLRNDKRLAARFFAEAQVTAQLEHPNIVPVYTLAIQPGDAPAYTMKLIEGRTVRELVEETRGLVLTGEPLHPRLSLQTRLDHFLKVCDAMSYAHSKGVIHRDLKPDNIMVGRYHQVYVMDWGLAKLIEARDPGHVPSADGQVSLVEAQGAGSGDDRRTQIGAVLGTPAYMPPEQALGLHDQLDGRSDLYALGLVLQELVTLQQAMPGGGAAGMVTNAAKGARLPVVPIEGKPIAKELVAIIDKATRLRRQDRYDSVDEFADDIRRFLRDEPVSALSDSVARKVRRWVGRHRFGTLGIVFVALLAASAIMGWTMWSEGRRAAEAGRVERRMTTFATTVASQGHLIDNHMLRLQSRLEALSATAVRLIDSNKPVRAPVFLADGYLTPGRGPSDVREAEGYGVLLSTAHPVFKLAPGVDEETVRPLLRRLAPMGVHFRRLFVESHSPEALKWSESKQHRFIRKKGSPVTWAYVGLVEGIHVGYPGKGGYPDDYDPRNRPWYRLSALKYGVHAGNPYVDVNGQGLMLPVSVSLYDSDFQFRGVAGMDLSFAYLIDNLLGMPGVDGILETRLLDDRGRTLVTSKDKGRTVTAGLHNDEGLRLELYPDPTVVEAIVAGRSGHAIVERDGTEVIVAWYHLKGTGWFYLAEAERAAVVDAPAGPAAPSDPAPAAPPDATPGAPAGADPDSAGDGWGGPEAGGGTPSEGAVPPDGRDR